MSLDKTKNIFETIKEDTWYYRLPDEVENKQTLRAWIEENKGSLKYFFAIINTLPKWYVKENEDIILIQIPEDFVYIENKNSGDSLLWGMYELHGISMSKLRKVITAYGHENIYNIYYDKPTLEIENYHTR